MRKNTILMMMYEVFALLVPLIITPFVSRALGADGVGYYSYSYSIVLYFIIAIQLGVKLYGRREIAKVNDNIEEYSKTFWEIITIEILLFIVVSATYFIFLFTHFGADKLLVTLLCIQFIELVAGLLDISWLFYGIEDFITIVIRNLIVRIIQFILILFLVNQSDDLVVYTAIMATCNLLGALSMWFRLGNKIVKPSILMGGIKERILPLLQLFIPVISSILFSVVDKTIIGSLLGMDSVGCYENSYKIAKVPVVIITVLGSVLLPRITKLLSDGNDTEARTYISYSMSVVMMISSALSFGLCLVAVDFIPLFLGEGFNDSIRLLEILSYMILFIGWGNVLRTQYMLPRGYDKLYTKSVVYASIINIVLSLLLINAMGVNGVAIASLVSEALICIYSSVKLRKEIDFKVLIRNNLIYFVAGFLMFVIIKSCRHQIIEHTSLLETLFVEAILGATIYIIFIVAYEIVTHKRVLLKELLNIKDMLFLCIKK